MPEHKIYLHFFKPLIDAGISLIALLILSPVISVFIILTAVVLKGNPFYLQKRVGKNGAEFFLMKLRSMTDERDAFGFLLKEEFRITKFGNFLRKTSLDELPQLINVIKGDMSLIGPRPLLVDYIPLYSESQKR